MLVAIIGIFAIGYLAIATEHLIKINKAATAMFTGVTIWTIFIVMSPDKHLVTEHLIASMGEFSGILFFLLGAMTIVELIDAHDGFNIITNKINVKTKRQLLWLICFVTFFLSAALDNLTTTIVMISLLSKFSLNREERLTFIGMVILAANSGGAWSPIGDVTTTMLWIGGTISSTGIIAQLIFPSLVCMIIPTIVASFMIKGNLDWDTKINDCKSTITTAESMIVLFVGIGGIIFVPAFKTLTHLPPFMGMLLALSALWFVTEFLHGKKCEEDKNKFSVATALQSIDISSILFFLGILICIASLEGVGVLHQLQITLDKYISNINLINFLIGILSAIVDNVPLVAGMMKTYTLDMYPVDHPFWIFLSYCAGTGGSILIIGSAAGVAAMGIAKIDFLWYLKKITPIAFLGYIAGAGAFLLQTMILK
jgi:Na+/H+ antiporter NhaD/arsenite permease-like protein